MNTILPQTLGTVITITKGRKHELSEKPSENSKRLIGIDDLRNDTIMRYTDDIKGTESKPKDVLIAWDGANAGTIGFGKTGFIGSTIARLRIKNDANLFTPFLGLFLKSKFNYLRQTATGATIPHINRAALESISLPQIDFDDQIRIAHLLSKVEGLIAQRKQHLQQLDELLKSVFLEMFGDPVRNERGWDKVSFSNILAEIESGKSPTCEARQATEDEWGVLKLGSVTSCVYKQEENKALPQDVAPDTRWEVKQGDLIFSRKNTYELVAACAYVFETRSKLLLPDLIFRFVFKDDAEIHPLFIWKLLTADSQRKQVQSLAAGASGSMPNISKANLKQTLLIKPPIELQDEFAGIVERVEGIKARYQASLAELERLYGVLSQRAFKGELDLSRVVVPDVSTEPDIETQEMHTEDTESLSPLSALLEATINPPEADHRILVPHFNAYLDTLNGGEFNLESCASFIQDQVVGLDPEYPYFLSLHEYETIYKKLIFDALADGRLEQTRNIVVIDDKEDFGNNIILRPCKVQRE